MFLKVIIRFIKTLHLLRNGFLRLLEFYQPLYSIVRLVIFITLAAVFILIRIVGCDMIFVIRFIYSYANFKPNSHLTLSVVLIMLESIQILIFGLMIFVVAKIIYYSFIKYSFFNLKFIIKYSICDDFFSKLMKLIYQSLITEILTVLIMFLISTLFD